MSDLTSYILQAMYEATEHDWRAVPVVTTLRTRWPQLRPEDILRDAGMLAERGQLTLRPDGSASITGNGVQALSQLWKAGAFGPVPPAAAPHVERLHQLAEASSTTDLATIRRRASNVPAPALGALDRKSVAARIAEARRASQEITRAISNASDLPMESWVGALELTAELDGAIDQLETHLR